MRKFLIALIAMLTFGVVLSGCNDTTDTGSENSDTDKKEEVVTLIAAHGSAETTPYHSGMEKFKETLEEISNGSMIVNVHSLGELGDEPELVEKVSTGTVDMTVSAPAFMAQSVPEIDFFVLPYLFNDYDQWVQAVDGEVGEKMANIVEEKTNYKVLGYWKAGVRDIFGTKPIEKPEDLNGVTIRVPSSPLTHDIWTSFKAQPVTVAFTELYQAFQSNVVETSENDFANILAMSFHEVAPHLSLTGHELTVRPLIMNKQKFDSLTEEQQKWVETAAEAATEYEREVDDQTATESLEQMIDEGAVVHEVDKELFAEVLRPIQDKWAAELGLEDLLDKIRALE